MADQLEATGFHYVQSHQNDPLGCAVAKEIIAVMREEACVEKGNALGQYLLEGMKRLAGSHACVKEARGRGPLLALEFNPDGGLSTEGVFRALLERGFLVGCRPADHILRFDPALTMEKADVGRLLQCLDDVLSMPA